MVNNTIVSTNPSIHRQRLGQIPRKIRIKPAHHAHVIREQLQRQDGEQGVGLRVGVGDDDQVVAVGAQAGVLFRDDDGARAAYFDLVDAADDERHIVRSRDKDDRESLADRGERSMLELGREHPFAMGVGDLLQLQRAFEGNRVGRAVAEAVHVVPLVDVFGNRFDLRGNHLDRLLHQVGDARKVGGAFPSHAIRQVQERHDLVGKGLRGWHADFVAAAQG